MCDRVNCLVPFCKCSTKQKVDEWICAKHWALVPKVRKRWYNLAKRRRRRLKTPASALTAIRLWEYCKRAAIRNAL